MQRAISRLMAESLPEEEWLRSQAQVLGAFPVGWDLWSYWFLRPDGEVVIADQEFEPGRIAISRERGEVLSALVRLSERYPELNAVLPAREPGAVDCSCLPHRRLLPAKFTCTMCGGLGWLPDKNT
jgi:hypothetical protein